ILRRVLLLQARELGVDALLALGVEALALGRARSCRHAIRRIEQAPRLEAVAEWILLRGEDLLDRRELGPKRQRLLEARRLGQLVQVIDPAWTRAAESEPRRRVEELVEPPALIDHAVL